MLLDPGDDGDCLPLNNVKFTWRAEGNPYPVSSYLEVRRFEETTKEWRPWVKAYANPPYTMIVKPNSPAFAGATFAWRVWAVDRTGQTKPYATPSEWKSFCLQDK
jgi:hypothetical protein